MFRLTLFLFLFCGFTVNSHAEFIDLLDKKSGKNNDKFFDPKFSFRIASDFKFDDNYQYTKRKSEYKDTKFKFRKDGKFAVNENLYVKSYLKLEREDDSLEKTRRNQLGTGGGDRSLENLGVHLEELNINYRYKNLALKAGKTNLNFGKAWDWKRGIWAYNLSKNYKQTEKLGVGGFFLAGDEGLNGEYKFSFFAFKDDSKNLDNSLITKRSAKAKSQNHPGDRSGLKSYTAALDINFDFGEKYNEQERLSYHFSYLKLALRDKDSQGLSYQLQDQNAYALGMKYILPISHNYAIDGLYEFVDMQNIEGNQNISEKYHTISFINKFYQKYNLTLVSSWLYNQESFAYGFDQNLSEISAGYSFGPNQFFDKLQLQFGYKKQRIDYKYSIDKQNSYGILLRYFKNF